MTQSFIIITYFQYFGNYIILYYFSLIPLINTEVIGVVKKSVHPRAKQGDAVVTESIRLTAVEIVE